MIMSLRSFVVGASTLAVATLAITTAGCSSASAGGPAPAPLSATDDAGASVAPPCNEGASRCEGTLVATCEAGKWSAAAACPGDQGCREDACQDPTARQRTQADSIGKLVETLARETAWHEVVDDVALTKRERAAILKGDGTDGPYLAAAWRVMNEYRQGHQSMYADEAVCGVAIPYQNTSRFSVCGRPHKDGVIVTLAKPNNPLGLKAGDVIVRAGADEKEALLEAAYLRPVCGEVFPAKSGRQAAGAASFFGTVPAKMALTVRAPDGSSREVVVPDQADGAELACGDPFARDRRVYAEAKRRPDGVAVIRLPSFFPYDKQFPTTGSQTELETFVAEYRTALAAIFDTVKDAPGIVWDARGNTGGITPVGLAIVGGFKSARATSLSYCKSREPASSPPSYLSETYAPYEITPGGPFAYAGKVAVVTDGLAYSAGDYFPLAVLRASDVPVVGTATAGAFGGGRVDIPLNGPPKLSCNYDPTACFDANDDAFLEAAPPAPTIAVDYSPADLAAGRDTLIERAVQALGL